MPTPCDAPTSPPVQEGKGRPPTLVRVRSRTSPRLLAALTTALTTVVVGALLSAPTAAADPRRPAPGGGGDGPRDRTTHSSDGVRGEIAPRILGRAAAPVDTGWLSYPMAPGLTYTQWDRADDRGTIRAYLMTAQLGTPGLSVDYLGADEVPEREDVLDMVVEQAAIGGVNGDFFDISDTGAPLGIGASREDGLIHGRTSGWNEAFSISKAGVPEIGALEVKAKVKGHDELRLEYVNSPTVFAGRVGVFTPEWGRTSGSSVVDGQKKNVREVVIDKNRVVSNKGKLSNGKKIRGAVLVGRDKMAKRLAKLKVGSKVKVNYRLAGRPQVALTGNRQLVDERIRTVVDDREMHPRTAIGIDRDTNSVLFLVIDGRQSFSRGYTMVELANLMIELGAEDALNLDGGGSSTMVGLRPDGSLGVLNSPSDGQQRPVPDGLQLTYTPLTQ
jgi:hypothetical protein